MSINLQKGQKINLSKESRSGLNKVMVGLGWDEVPQKRGLFAPKPQDIDCDAFAILLGYSATGVRTNRHLLYYFTKKLICSIRKRICLL